MSYLRRMSFHVLYFLQLLCFPLVVEGQHADTASLRQMVLEVNRFTEEHAAEKVYLHTDKTNYFAGDTLWFKAYLFNAAYLFSSVKSGIMYAEIANDSNRVVKRLMIPVYLGLAAGQFTLAEDEVPQGWYTLRAYTNWMRNFTESAICSKSFYVGAMAPKTWTISLKTGFREIDQQNRLHLQLKIDQLDKTPVGLRELQITVSDKNKKLDKQKLQTNPSGELDVDFNLGNKSDLRNLAVSIEDLRKGEGGRIVRMPVPVRKSEDIDVQFLPEGGKLVAGIPSVIAFKALAADGLGVEIRGRIRNSKSQEVAKFESLHKGMGSVTITPEPGERYWASLDHPAGVTKKYVLPSVEAKGTSLSLLNSPQSDTCEIIVSATPDLAQTSLRYYLIGEARGIACFASSFFLNKTRASFKVDKRNFPQGIIRFTLAGPDRIVLNERLAFVDHKDNLVIKLESNKRAYERRDSVTLKIKASDKKGSPVVGSFSLAVTDDGQYNSDSLATGSIESHLLLSSDLKGNIEHPGYYFNASSSNNRWKALDLLLLTQGWASYDWTNAFKPRVAYKYAPEPEFTVKGRITNLVNKPVAGANVLLLSKKPAIYKDTLTNNLGVFTFRGINPSDSAAYFIQVKNRKGKNSAADIQVDTFSPPVFKDYSRSVIPWFVNIDTAKLETFRRRVQMREESVKAGSNMLREVIIKAKKVVKDSKNLNGPGQADMVIDEKELEVAGKTTLLQLLEKRVKGFSVRTSKTGVRYFAINGNFLHLIIDGVNTEFFYSGAEPVYEFFKQFFDYYDASEIKGIEVMTSGGYQMRYSSAFLPPMTDPFAHSFLEITTRGGVGPFLKKTTGTFLYKPLPFTFPKDFYSPKYSPDSKPDMTDVRSTVFWTPNIITNQQGEAEVSFYTSDNPGRYSIIIEGSDMNGKIGSGRSVIIVDK